MGPEHPQLGRIVKNYAALLRATGRPDEAARLVTRD
jgi:hypothetical protein